MTTRRSDPRAVEDRKPINVDRDQFNRVLNEFGPRVSIGVPSTGPQSKERKIELEFRRMHDFSPDGIVDQVPALRALREARRAIADLVEPARASSVVVQKLLFLLEDPTMRAYLAAEFGLGAPPDAERASADCVVARDEAGRTSEPTRLFVLARHWSILVRRAVAENPAIDDESLGVLVPECLEQLAANASVRARAIANPLWALRWPALACTFLLHLPWTEAMAETALRLAWGDNPIAIRAYEAMELRPCEARPARAADAMDYFEAWVGKPSAPSRSSIVVEAASFQRSNAELESVLRDEAGRGEAVTDALGRLARRRPWFWRAIAEHPECPTEWLVKLAGAPQCSVRIAVIGRPHTPDAVLRERLRDEDASVREAAHLRLGLRFDAIGSRFHRARQDMRMVSEAMALLAEESRAQRRVYVDRPGRRFYLLEAFRRFYERRWAIAGEWWRSVMSATAAGPEPSEADFFRLFSEHPERVLEHPACPDALLEMVAKDRVNWLCQLDYGDAISIALLIVANHPKASDDALSALRGYSTIHERIADRRYDDRWRRRRGSLWNETSMSTFARLRSIPAMPNEKRIASSLILLKEYLRRAALWAKALESIEQWPFFDIALRVAPRVRAESAQVTKLAARLTEQGMAPLMRRTCEWILHWEALEERRETTRFGHLPAPYEPLLELYGRGATFRCEGDSLFIGAQSFRVREWIDYEKASVFTSLDPGELKRFDG